MREARTAASLTSEHAARVSDVGRLPSGAPFLARRADGTELVKVLDFGISKVAGAGPALTATAALMGSPLYMSPEQVRSSHDVDQRTDIWSLGCVLHELLTGQAVFESPKRARDRAKGARRRAPRGMPDAMSGTRRTLAPCRNWSRR